jgi:hypothetical protein
LTCCECAFRSLCCVDFTSTSKKKEEFGGEEGNNQETKDDEKNPLVPTKDDKEKQEKIELYKTMGSQRTRR